LNTSSSAAVKSEESQSQIPPKLSSIEIREKFLSFYESRSHLRYKSASLIPQDPTILLTIAGMVPFKDIFLGQNEAPKGNRATSSQKCIRTNDIENVGVTKRHHTFFEMLGNFSFGDYFKKDAITWAWQFLTIELQIPRERLAVSVYQDDDEAYSIWKDVIGIPQNRIQKLGEKDNFWVSGPTGPCGPCSEIYYDFQGGIDGAKETEHDPVDLEDDERFIELYNLVFMEYNRSNDGSLSALKSKNIDTGMGLERICQVLQQVDNNYETDLMLPIMQRAAKLANTEYYQATDDVKKSLKVIADHARAVMHLSADGVKASNVGRGYVLRRLLRRLVRHGRMIGIEGAFIQDVLKVSMEMAVSAGFGNVKERESTILMELGREESSFLATLERGEQMLQEIIAEIVKVGSDSGAALMISGDDAFELYDTYGFPLELTEETALENGIQVDIQRFNECMDAQKKRARAAHETIDVTTSEKLSEAVKTAGKTEFIGYDTLYEDRALVKSVLVSGDESSLDQIVEEGQNARIILDKSPFYAEGGGQVGDIGYLQTNSGAMFSVSDVKKIGDSWIHIGEATRGSISLGEEISAQVDPKLRRRTRIHHSATHLLQSALRKVFGAESISQAGSLVDSNRLRFDFNAPRALKKKELREIESIVNEWIYASFDTRVQSMTLDEAVENGAIAMFGEKYSADSVRVISIGNENCVSMELCGGTHVQNTSEIGGFRIISESGIASGVRRIEAVAGEALMEWAASRDLIVTELSDMFRLPADEIVGRVAALVNEAKEASKMVEKLKKEVTLMKSETLSVKVKQICGENGVIKGSVLVSRLDAGADSDALKSAATQWMNKLGESSVVLLASNEKSVESGEEKVVMVATAGKDALKAGIHCGQLVGKVAKLCGGGGGGRPNLAQAGAKESSKLDEALNLAQIEIETLFLSE